MGRPLRDLRRVEQRRGRDVVARPGPAGKAPAGRSLAFRRPGRQHRAAAARADRHRRTGPRAGRRAGAGLGGAGRRRSRHRQVDPAAAGGRAAGPVRPAGAVRLGRRVDRPGPAARAAAGGGGLVDRTRRRDQRPRHRRQPGAGQGHHAGGDRLDPDDVDGHDRKRARHRHAGPRRVVRADPPGQGRQFRAGAGRPRHQGRRSRRAARAGAHGRRRAVFRRRPRPPVPHPARGEEPLRRHRRDRRVRDDRDRPGGSAEPLRAVPGGAPRQHRRQRGVRRAGRLAAGADGGPGAAGAESQAARRGGR